MNALWKVGEFRSSHTPSETVLCLAKDQGEIERYEKHHSFVRWVYEHQGVYQCSGCGRKTDDPDKDYTALRDAGHISCCPDRKMVLAADAFKSYVHQRLDAMGVPPESEHEVGGRLDWVEKNLRQIADLALIELTASPAQPSGFALVPVEPTDAMLAAGHRNIDWCRDDQNTNTNDHPSQTDLGGTSCKTDLRDAYTAMLTAAPAPIEQEG